MYHFNMLSLKNIEIWQIATMSDWGVKITLYSPELPPEQMAYLFLAKKTGIAEQIDVEEKPSDWKTNSQRLRNTLYVYWEQVNKHGYKFFNDYYQAWLEKKIEEIKEKLPDQK